MYHYIYLNTYQIQLLDLMFEFEQNIQFLFLSMKNQLILFLLKAHQKKLNYHLHYNNSHFHPHIYFHNLHYYNLLHSRNFYNNFLQYHNI